MQQIHPDRLYASVLETFGETSVKNLVLSEDRIFRKRFICAAGWSALPARASLHRSIS